MVQQVTWLALKGSWLNVELMGNTLPLDVLKDLNVSPSL